MATTAITGNAQFSYTPQGGSPTTHTLAVPLKFSPAYGFRYRYRKTRFEAFNSDGTDREVYVLGDATHEIVAEVRYDDEPTALRDMLIEALENNVTLTYSPDGGGTTYPFLLVSVDGDAGELISLDPTRYAFGEYMTRLVLRRVDGGNLDALL